MNKKEKNWQHSQKSFLMNYSKNRKNKNYIHTISQL